MKNCILLLGLVFICRGTAGPMRKKSSLSAPHDISKRMVGKSPPNDNFNDLTLAMALFNYSDINRDSYLSQYELKSLYLRLYKFSENQAEDISSRLIQLGDLDGDGRLNLSETILAMKRVQDMYS